MIDTLGLQIDHTDLPINYHIFLFNKLSNDNFREEGAIAGVPKIKGKYKNLNFTLTGKGLKVDGSLTKYIVGDNLKTVYKEDIIEFINELNEQFNVNFFKSKVKRVDFAGNIITKYPIKEYTDCLYDLKFFDRCEQQNGLSYLNDNRSIVFYDKIKEMKKKDRLKIDPILLTKNVLRYEFRYKKNQPLSSFLKVDKARLMDVMDNYHVLVDQWLDVFKMINKRKDPQPFSLELFNTKGALDKHLIRMGIEAIGGELKLLEMINYGKKRKYFGKYPNMASNLRGRYKKLMVETSSKTCHDFVSELQNKIDLFNMYAHPKFQNEFAQDLIQ